MRIISTILLVFSVLIAESKISGVAFYNYSCDLTEGVEGSDKGSFSFNRVYFTYKNNISKDISFKFQTDVGNVPGIGDDARLISYLKKAQLDWKSSIGKITLGMQGMNMFNVTEKTWGFRFIEKTPMDRYGFSSSADMGIGYSGKFDNLSYSILSTNGSGYKKQEDDAFKKTSIQLVYGEKKLNKNNGFNIGTSVSMENYMRTDGKKNKMAMSFFGGYAGSRLRVGGEFDMHTDSGTDVTKQIMALYASYKAIDNLEGLVYLDMYDPWTDSIDYVDTGDIDESKDNETYIIAGFNYYVSKGLIITPNIRMTLFEDGSDNKTVFKINFQFGF